MRCGVAMVAPAGLSCRPRNAPHCSLPGFRMRTAPGRLDADPVCACMLARPQAAPVDVSIHAAPALVQCQFLQGNSQDGPATGGRAGGRGGEGGAGWQCKRLYRLCCSAPPRLSSRAL